MGIWKLFADDFKRLKGRAIWNYGIDREVQVMMFDPEKVVFPQPKPKPEVKHVDLLGVV